MTRDDLRCWLEKITKERQLIEIKGADWDCEIGALSFLNASKKGSPALLFDDIREYPPGYRVISCTMCNAKTLAITFGLAPTYSNMDLVDVFRERFSGWIANWQKFPPQVVNTGPILENVQTGKDVDVLKFPSPKWHEMDGGRYIGTGDAIITQDPDNYEVNLGTYRVMVYDERTVAFQPAFGRHG